MTKLVVIDCETTGLGKHDRVVEIAAVTLEGSSMEIVDEYDTLINPERDMGPVNIHGVTASMVEAAPSFAEIAGALGARLNGAVLVAHNLAFDTRMISREYERIAANFDAGVGVCTLAKTRQKLKIACEHYGITLAHQHRALADARATAALLAKCNRKTSSGVPASVAVDSLDYNSRTHRRDASDQSRQSDLARIVSQTHYPSSSNKIIQYLDMLDWVLDDLEITKSERAAMEQLATQLGLTGDEVASAHRAYQSAIIAAARRDGIVTESEKAIIRRVSETLNLDVPQISVSSHDANSAEIKPSCRVCFTGTAIVEGRPYSRSELEKLAVDLGLQPTSSVTKKGCDLLVAADPSSMSGKAKKARRFGIPVITTETFLASCK